MGNKIQRIYIGTNQVRPSYTQWTPSSSTIGYWELNGNSNDTKNDYGVTTYTSTDYDANGYVGAGNPTYTSGRHGKQCAVFDGTRGLELPSLPIPSNTITVSLWAKFISTGSGALFQLREDTNANAGEGWALKFSIGNGTVTAEWVATNQYSGTSGQAGYSVGGTSVSLGEWYNMVITFNSGTVKFYINGDLKGQKGSKPYLRNKQPISPSYIGVSEHEYQGTTNFSNCYIQDVIYENRTWSDQDVVDYYATF